MFTYTQVHALNRGGARREQEEHQEQEEYQEQEEQQLKQSRHLQ
jgi:hypothetical protein